MDKKPTFRSYKMLLAELVVIFLGVYGAFWVDNYRDEQERDERTKQVILVLRQDLEDGIEVGGVFDEAIETGLLEWSIARKKGETPPPYVFRIYGTEKPPLTTWEIVRQTQLSDLLQANLLYELGFYYNELDGVGDKATRYLEFTESQVLPLLKSGSTGFYSDDKSRLLPKFEAHMDRLREWAHLQNDMQVWAACLITRLESADEITEGCRTDVGVTVME